MTVSQRLRATVVGCWKRLPDRCQSFSKNVALGFVTLLLVSRCESNVGVENARSLLLTWQSAYLGSSLAPELVWIDIDDETYWRWNAPSVTPRDKLCQLIDYALSGNPSVVVVDMDLSVRAGYEKRSIAKNCNSSKKDWGAQVDANKPDQADQLLKKRIETYECEKRDVPCPLLVLTRTLRRSPQFFYADGEHAREPRASLLDDSYKLDDLPNSASVMWSTPNFQLDDDYVIRRWRLWETRCGDCNSPVALPSTELLAVAAYLKVHPPGPGITIDSPSDITDKLNRLGMVCRSLRNGKQIDVTRLSSAPAPIEFGSFNIALEQAQAERRFFYRFGWWHAGATRRTLAYLIPAWTITEFDQAHRPSLDHQRLTGRIVVIGGSYQDDPDFYRTPLGEMPGTLVLLNAIHALLNNDHFKEWPVWERLLGQVAEIVIVALIFTWLHPTPARAMLVAIASVAIVAFVVGWTVLNNGYWFDPVIPILGILAHEGYVLVTTV